MWVDLSDSKRFKISRPGNYYLLSVFPLFFCGFPFIFKGLIVLTDAIPEQRIG